MVDGGQGATLDMRPKNTSREKGMKETDQRTASQGLLPQAHLLDEDLLVDDDLVSTRQAIDPSDRGYISVSAMTEKHSP